MIPAPTMTMSADSFMSIPLHDLAEGDAEVLTRAVEMGMNGQSPAKQIGGLAIFAERHVAEPLPRERAEVVRVPCERLPAVRDRVLVLLRHVPNRRALVPSLREARRGLDEL